MEMRVIGNLPVSILTSSPIYGSSTLFLSREQYRRTVELSIPFCSMKVSSVTSAGQGAQRPVAHKVFQIAPLLKIFVILHRVGPRYI
jgi:hypothetical protein